MKNSFIEKVFNKKESGGFISAAQLYCRQQAFIFYRGGVNAVKMRRITAIFMKRAAFLMGMAFFAGIMLRYHKLRE
jgi:hypothetical protein